VSLRVGRYRELRLRLVDALPGSEGFVDSRAPSGNEIGGDSQ
jgi:hypothetical protein